MKNDKPLYMLDTSALMTFIEDEDGADRVQHILARYPTLIASVSLLEVSYLTIQERGQAEADVRYALLKRLGATILWELDEPTILIAAKWKAAHRVSFADTVIAAYARRHKATLLHKDHEFEVLQDQLEMEALPYKPKKREATTLR